MVKPGCFELALTHSAPIKPIPQTKKMTQPSDKQALIARLNSETAKISWLELQKHYASGNVLGVAPGADLIKVAIALNEDNAPQIQAWLSDKSVFEVADQQAMKWYENQTILWALVIPPFVLVQEPSTLVRNNR